MELSTQDLSILYTLTRNHINQFSGDPKVKDLSRRLWAELQKRDDVGLVILHD